MSKRDCEREERKMPEPLTFWQATNALKIPVNLVIEACLGLRVHWLAEHDEDLSPGDCLMAIMRWITHSLHDDLENMACGRYGDGRGDLLAKEILHFVKES